VYSDPTPKIFLGAVAAYGTWLSKNSALPSCMKRVGLTLLGDPVNYVHVSRTPLCEVTGVDLPLLQHSTKVSCGEMREIAWVWAGKDGVQRAGQYCLYDRVSEEHVH
jgi:hypothetical protein